MSFEQKFVHLQKELGVLWEGGMNIGLLWGDAIAQSHIGVVFFCCLKGLIFWHYNSVKCVRGLIQFYFSFSHTGLGNSKSFKKAACGQWLLILILKNR